MLYNLFNFQSNDNEIQMVYIGTMNFIQKNWSEPV